MGFYDTDWVGNIGHRTITFKECFYLRKFGSMTQQKAEYRNAICIVEAVYNNVGICLLTTTLDDLKAKWLRNQVGCDDTLLW